MAQNGNFAQYNGGHAAPVAHNVNHVGGQAFGVQANGVPGQYNGPHAGQAPHHGNQAAAHANVVPPAMIGVQYGGELHAIFDDADLPPREQQLYQAERQYARFMKRTPQKSSDEDSYISQSRDGLVPKPKSCKNLFGIDPSEAEDPDDFSAIEWGLDTEGVDPLSPPIIDFEILGLGV